MFLFGIIVIAFIIALVCFMFPVDNHGNKDQSVFYGDLQTRNIKSTYTNFPKYEHCVYYL